MKRLIQTCTLIAGIVAIAACGGDPSVNFPSEPGKYAHIKDGSVSIRIVSADGSTAEDQGKSGGAASPIVNLDACGPIHTTRKGEDIIRISVITVKQSCPLPSEGDYTIVI
jgi:hypothetical protein